MSTTTENFGIVLPEGSDTFNPLTFNNNAFTKVDEVLKANQDRGITSATHTYIDGINTILRAVATCNAMIFVASADYEAGSTIAVDGVTCTFRYADGTAPKSGAFKTNQAVMCFLNGTILTLISAKAAPNAEEIAYDDSDVKSALDSINTNLSELNIVRNYNIDYSVGANNFTSPERSIAVEGYTPLLAEVIHSGYAGAVPFGVNVDNVANIVTVNIYNITSQSHSSNVAVKVLYKKL